MLVAMLGVGRRHFNCGCGVELVECEAGVWFGRLVVWLFGGLTETGQMKVDRTRRRGVFDWWGGRRSAVVLVMTMLIVCLFDSSQGRAGEETPELSQLLKTFVDELVAITPGEGKFPAEVVVPFNGDVVDGKPKTFRLEHPFAIAKYEVPQNLYEAVMGANPSKWTGARNSVEMMTWGEAREFCIKLTQQLRDAKLIADTEEIRLPTEVEWEYCCRAGTDTAYSFGDAAQGKEDEGTKASLLDEYAWHTGNAAGNDPPVGALKPNPWGLYDMHGYLWEFCSDPWSDEVTSGAGGANEEAERIVVRGGSWKDRFEKLTSASRRGFAVDARDDAVGLRCVRASVR